MYTGGGMGVMVVGVLARDHGKRNATDVSFKPDATGYAMGYRLKYERHTSVEDAT